MKVSSVVQGLLDNKKEYQDHLMDVITEPLIMSFQTMYEANLKTPEARAHGPLQSFQDLMTKIPTWNQMMVSDQYEKLRERSGCSYIQDLIRAILITYVKINMASQKGSTDIQKFKLRVPSGENFIHRCMILAAREMWKQPYLLYHQVRTIERQKNLVELENIIRKAIRGAIRMYVPMEQLVLHVNESSDPMDESGSDESESEREESEDSPSSEEESEEESEQESETEDEDEELSDEDEDPATPIEVIHKEDSVSDHDDEATLEIMREPVNEVVIEEEPVNEVVTAEEPVEETLDNGSEPEAPIEIPSHVNENVLEMKDLLIHTPNHKDESSGSDESDDEPEDVYERPAHVEEEERKEITILGKDDVATKNKDKQLAFGTMLLNRGNLHRPKISRNKFGTPKSNAFF